MKRLFELKPMYVITIPKVKEHGILYISHKFEIAIHLCACGCGRETVTPLKEWKLTKTIIKGNTKFTLRPSIGNFSGEKPYHAHYYITDNKIQWL